MTKEWKERLEKIGIGIFTALIVLVIGALLKGDELKGLGKAAALGRVLNSAIPLWLFLIVLVVAILASVRWYKSRNRPLVYVEWKNDISLWCVATAGNEKWMQVMLHGFFTNCDRKDAIIITSVYLEGTKPAMSLHETITLPPEHVCNEDVTAMVKPVVLEEGKTFRGKVILVDQFQRKHRVPIELKGHAPEPHPNREADKSAT